jgi:hypothetical protein
MSILKKRSSVIRVTDEAGRQSALAVLRATYRNEKNWTTDEETLFAESDLQTENISWFVVFYGDEPVGVLRVFYDPRLDFRPESMPEISATSF